MRVYIRERAPAVWTIRVESRDAKGQRSIASETVRGTRETALKRREAIIKTKHGTLAAVHKRTQPRPVGLSDVQLELLIDKASTIEPVWRSRWLANVVDRLLMKESISDAELEAACFAVSMRIKGKGHRTSEPELRHA
jgi:hypothetical protein